MLAKQNSGLRLLDKLHICNFSNLFEKFEILEFFWKLILRLFY